MERAEKRSNGGEAESTLATHMKVTQPPFLHSGRQSLTDVATGRSRQSDGARPGSRSLHVSFPLHCACASVCVRACRCVEGGKKRGSGSRRQKMHPGTREHTEKCTHARTVNGTRIMARAQACTNAGAMEKRLRECGEQSEESKQASKPVREGGEEAAEGGGWALLDGPGSMNYAPRLPERETVSSESRPG